MIDKKPSCPYSGPTVPPISECQRSTSGRGKKTISHGHCSPVHPIIAMATLVGYIEHYS